MSVLFARMGEVIEEEGEYVQAIHKAPAKVYSGYVEWRTKYSLV